MGNVLEQQIAELIAILLIDLAQRHQIDQQHRKTIFRITLVVLQGMVEAVQEQGTIGQLGQRIALCIELHLPLELIALFELALQPQVQPLQLL